LLINKAGMREFQIDREQTGKGVGSKIQYMEFLFRKCDSFINATGQGIMAEQGLSKDDPKFMSYVKQKWEHYYDLEPIMSERSGNRFVSNCFVASCLWQASHYIFSSSSSLGRP